MEVLVTEHGTALGIEDTDQSDSALQRTYQRTPERLRIRYVPLIKMLERICSETLSNSEVWGPRVKPEGGAPTVILRPWKLFVAYEKEIRNSVQEVESLVEAGQQTQGNGKADGKGIVEECE